LVLGEGNTSRIASEVLGSISNKSSPSTTNIEESKVMINKTCSRKTTRCVLVSGLKVQFVAHDGKLVILELLQRFLGVEVKNDTGGINHAGTKEPENKSIRAQEPNRRNSSYTPFVKVIATYTGTMLTTTIE
jgi:hypothetical protein